MRAPSAICRSWPARDFTNRPLHSFCDVPGGKIGGRLLTRPRGESRHGRFGHSYSAPIGIMNQCKAIFSNRTPELSD